MRARLIDAKSTSTFTLADAQSWTDSTPFGWIEIEADGPNDTEARDMLSALGFTSVAVTYAMRSNVSGMFRRYGDALVGTTWLAALPSQIPSNINFAWDAHRMVTIRFGCQQEMDAVVEQATGSAASLFSEPSSAPPIILHMVLAGLDRQLTALELQVAEVDEDIVEKVEPSQLTTLRAVRTNTTPLAQRFPGYSDALNTALITPATLANIDSAGIEHLQSYATHVQDTVSRIGDLVDAMHNALQDYQTEVGNHQGDRINQLTIVSILFLPVTFLTGYFGMNFQWLDNELMSLGSWLLLGVLVPILVVIVSAVVLARRGYLASIFGSRKRRSPTSDAAVGSVPHPRTTGAKPQGSSVNDA